MKLIDKAKKELDACGSQDCDAARQIFRLFSELNVSEDEDEDEKIIKEIINYFECQSRDEPCRKLIHDKWIAWIEKQGQTFTKEDTDNANKVEPKFKAGNWYQCTKDFFGKGVTFDKNTAYYCAQEGCLQNEYGCHIAIVKDLYDNFKLWAIQDAKDGDVLATEDWVFIFEKMKSNGKPACYCHYDIELGFRIDTNSYIATGSEIYPATKEQRDTLFKAMADAGYTFSFEKKELKKISQRMISAEAKEAMYGKPTAWSENDEYIIERLSYLLDNEQENYPQLSCDFQEIQEFKDWLKSLKERIGG